MNFIKTLLLLLLSGLGISVSQADSTLKPRSFRIPLALITTLFDENNSFVEAFVTYGNTSEGWAIGMVDDRYVKDTKRERVDHFYRERRTSAHYLSPFEAKVLEEVVSRLEETCVIYEKDLKHQRWDRLLFLDSYFPTFFRGFFYLYSAAHNSFSALPKVTKIEDSLYDDAVMSPISERRIATWRANPEQVVKLRIAAKELVFQLKQWRIKVLTIPEIDPRQDRSKEMRESYELFIRLYFNLPPASVIKKRIF